VLAAYLAGRPALAALSGTWTHVATRSYGTEIYRVDGRSPYYVKIAPRRERDDTRFHPDVEAERFAWLGAVGFPVPVVVDVGADSDAMWLVTSAVPGRSAAADWDTACRASVVAIVADLTRSMHALRVADCPFDRRLAVTLPEAQWAVALGRLDLDDLDEEHAGWSAERLLAELTAAGVPDGEDLVVCHGDLCLDNILVSADARKVTGVLDVGRLGMADRWLDLSIVLRSIGEDTPGYGPADAAAFATRYGAPPDERKRRFYRLLDEFV